MVAQAGAPSQPFAGSVPGGQTSPARVSTAGPHASWCMSSTTYRPYDAACRTAFLIRATYASSYAPRVGSSRDQLTMSRTELNPRRAISAKSERRTGTVVAKSGLAW
jgi:hypothetical protein